MKAKTGRLSQVFVAGIVVSALSGCGGGGTTMEDPMAAYGEALMRLDQSNALQSIGDAVSASVEGDPVFGSVTQSGVYDGDTFVSTGKVDNVLLSLSYSEGQDGERLVHPSYGARILLGEDGGVGFDYDGHLPMSRMETITGTLPTWVGVTVDQRPMDPDGNILRGTTWASWDPDAASNEDRAYVVGGHWLDVREQDDGTYSLHSLGAFVDAPSDFSDDRFVGDSAFPWQAIAGQTATYEGEAYGMYAGHQPAEATTDGIAVWHIGDFAGDVRLEASFGNQPSNSTISGLINNIVVDYAYLSEGNDEGKAEWMRGRIDPANYTIDLGTAHIPIHKGTGSSNFVGRTVTLNHVTDTLESSGTWGGEFSRIHQGGWDYSDDPPRLVAGTFGGTGTTSTGEIKGATVSFVGSFAAGPQREPDNPDL